MGEWTNRASQSPPPSPLSVLLDYRAGGGDDLMEAEAENGPPTPQPDPHAYFHLFQAALAKASGQGQLGGLVELLEGVSLRGVSDVISSSASSTSSGGGYASPIPPPPPPPLPPSLCPAKAQPNASLNSSAYSTGSAAEEPTSPLAELLRKKAGNLTPKEKGPRPASVAVAPPPPAPSLPPMKGRVNVGGQAPAAPLPQMLVPSPSARLRSFAWQKLPPARVSSSLGPGSPNLWLAAADKVRSPGFQKPNFARLEALFSVPDPKQTSGDSPQSGTLERRLNTRQVKETVNLLSRQRSLAVNIFLKQFKDDGSELILGVAKFRWEGLGAEKLRGLAKLLPEKEEAAQLDAYAGDIRELGLGEQFYVRLMAVPDYELRVESLLLRAELRGALATAEAGVGTALEAGRSLRDTAELHEVLTLLLIAGNFLNSGRETGNAAGFALSSLWKILEIRANEPSVTLLHYVAEEAEEKNPRLLDLPRRLPHLHKASQEPLETFRNDLASFKERTRRVSAALKTATQELPGMEQFLSEAETKLASLSSLMEELEKLRVELARFFCEDESTFRLEEAFKLFHIFAMRLGKAGEENRERKAKAARDSERRTMTLPTRRPIPRAATSVRLKVESSGMGTDSEAVEEEGREMLATLDRWRCWGSSIRRSPRPNRPPLNTDAGWMERERTVSWRERMMRESREKEEEEERQARVNAWRQNSPVHTTLVEVEASPAVPGPHLLRSTRRRPSPAPALPPPTHTNIDDVVRHCERTKQQIDQMNRPEGEGGSGGGENDEGFETESRGSSDPTPHSPSPPPILPSASKGSVPSYLAPTKAALSRASSTSTTLSGPKTGKSPAGKVRQLGSVSSPMTRRSGTVGRQATEANTPDRPLSASARFRPTRSTASPAPKSRPPIPASFRTPQTNATQKAVKRPSGVTDPKAKGREPQRMSPGTAKRWERLMSPPVRLTQPTSTTATTASRIRHAPNTSGPNSPNPPNTHPHPLKVRPRPPKPSTPRLSTQKPNAWRH